ncbi:MAG: hypothetical protein JNL94_15335 [Planctomycetes bacterium]|nr:hypothetical protein [Planctomycetota bacterium]
MTRKLIRHTGTFVCAECGKSFRLVNEASLKCGEDFCSGVLEPADDDERDEDDFDDDEDDEDDED